MTVKIETAKVENLLWKSGLTSYIQRHTTSPVQKIRTLLSVMQMMCVCACPRVGCGRPAWELPPPLIELVSTHHHTQSADQPTHATVRTAALTTGSLGVETDATRRADRAISSCWHQLGIPPEIAKRIICDDVDAQDPLFTVFAQRLPRSRAAPSAARS